MNSDSVVSVFNALFSEPYKTRLLGGATEPFYEHVPGGIHQIHFRADYVSSALHEVAHWCIAGGTRRQIDDYGYFYVSQRNQDQQHQFQMVERRPQALEWVFSVAAGVPFRISLDNFGSVDPTPFAEQVKRAAQQLLSRGLPARAQSFAGALSSTELSSTMGSVPAFLDCRNYQARPAI